MAENLGLAAALWALVLLWLRLGLGTRRGWRNDARTRLARWRLARLHLWLGLARLRLDSRRRLSGCRRWGEGKLFFVEPDGAGA